MRAVYRLLGLDLAVPPVRHAFLDPRAATEAVWIALA
jgi:hypothetical protein